MPMAADVGVVLATRGDPWNVFGWVLAVMAVVALFVGLCALMRHMGMNGFAFALIAILILGLAYCVILMGEDAEGTYRRNEAAFSSTYRASDVRLADGSMRSLLTCPGDGSWPATYKDSKGVRRSGRVEITLAPGEDGTAVIRLLDGSGRPVPPPTARP